MSHSSLSNHEVMNVACGDQVSLNELVQLLQFESDMEINANYAPERIGDVKHSKASINKITKKLFFIYIRL